MFKFVCIAYLTAGFFFGFMHLCSVLRVEVKWLGFCVRLLWYHVHTQCSIAFKDFMIQFSCFEFVTVNSKKIFQSQNWLRLMGLDKLTVSLTNVIIIFALNPICTRIWVHAGTMISLLKKWLFICQSGGRDIWNALPVLKIRWAHWGPRTRICALLCKIVTGYVRLSAEHVGQGVLYFFSSTVL